MSPYREPRNPSEVPVRDGNPRAEQPKVLTAVALGAPVAQPNLEAGALLQVFQGFLQLQQQVLQ